MTKVTMTLVKGLRGMIDDLVFRNVNGSIIVSKRPTYRKGKQSELQKLNCVKFKRVSAEVKKKLTDPEVRAHYKREAERLKLPNAYTAAVREGMRAGVSQSPD